MAAAGGFLIYVGIRKVPLQQGLREILRGQLPTGTPAVKAEVPSVLGFRATDTANAGLFGPASGLGNVGGTAGGGGGAGGAAIVAAARKYLGIPYVWGGAKPQDGFDCSGLVTWVLVKDLGYTNLPSAEHTVTQQFYVWRGATTVPRNQASAGDLACTMGHIGICIDGAQMIHAPTLGDVVKIGPITRDPNLLIRRVNPK